MAASKTASKPSVQAAPKAAPSKIDSDLAGAIDAIADKAATAHVATSVANAPVAATPDVEATAPAKTPAKAPVRRRAGDGMISEPAGPTNKYGISNAAWTLPKDGFVLALAKLIAVKPGISLDEASCVIHGQDSDGNPTRRGTTAVYQTWDLPRKGFGLKRQGGGLHLVMPEGHDVKEVASAPSAKLDGLIEARKRDDLAELVANNA